MGVQTLAFNSQGSCENNACKGLTVTNFMQLQNSLSYSAIHQDRTSTAEAKPWGDNGGLVKGLSSRLKSKT